jgi:hypothetical protein
MVLQQLAGAALIAAGTGAREVAGGQQEDAIRRTTANRERAAKAELGQRVDSRERELAMLFDADAAKTQRLKELGIELAQENPREEGVEMFRAEMAGAEAALDSMAPAPTAPAGAMAGGGVQDRVAAEVQQQTAPAVATQEQLAGQASTQEAQRETMREGNLKELRAPDLAEARMLFEQDRMRLFSEQQKAEFEFQNDLKQASQRGAILNAFGGLAQQVGGGLLGGGMGK